MKCYFRKKRAGLVPLDDSSIDWFDKLKMEAVVSVEVKKTRNYQFLKKWYALLKCGFDQWTPQEATEQQLSNLHLPEGVKPKKTFDIWRKDVIILTGRYDTVYRANGDLRIIAKSVSFGNMTEEDFKELYDDTINVLLKYCFRGNITHEELDQSVNNFLSFW